MDRVWPGYEDLEFDRQLEQIRFTSVRGNALVLSYEILRQHMQ